MSWDEDTNPVESNLTRMKVQRGASQKLDFDKKPFTTKIVCFGCTKYIDEDVYYKCIYHRWVFCESCAKNDHKRSKDFRDSMHCISAGYVYTHHWKDCELQRIEVTEDEKEYE